MKTACFLSFQDLLLFCEEDHTFLERHQCNPVRLVNVIAVPSSQGMLSHILKIFFLPIIDNVRLVVLVSVYSRMFAVEQYTNAPRV